MQNKYAKLFLILWQTIKYTSSSIILEDQQHGPASSATTDAFLAAFNQHLICNHIVTGLVLPAMKEAHYGRIINIISTSVKIP